jgi:hypothetical protein
MGLIMFELMLDPNVCKFKVKIWILDFFPDVLTNFIRM